MRLSVLQSNLAKGLSIVSRAVESRPSMPVLSNVLLKTEESRLKLAAVNLSLGLGITVWIGANVEIEGAVTLPAKVFVDLVNNLSNDRVDLQLDTVTQTMHLREPFPGDEVRVLRHLNILGTTDPHQLEPA